MFLHLERKTFGSVYSTKRLSADSQLSISEEFCIPINGSLNNLVLSTKENCFIFLLPRAQKVSQQMRYECTVLKIITIFLSIIRIKHNNFL